MLPYVDAVAERVARQSRADPETISTDGADIGQQRPPFEPARHGTSDHFHLALHELRTLQLERVPKGATTALGVGAQGRWYFDWFERAVGVLDEHVGVEAYEPTPADLPAYATWVADTADHMHGVADASVDLVFAGQTTEHLWAHELSGFLCESHRVLRDGGMLVLDSPNRLVTEHLRWSHGGHTIELSASEMTALLGLAGFDVFSVAGLWHCLLDDAVLQLEERLDDPAIFARRCAAGAERPDECFVWWINARRVDVEPRVEELEESVAALFEQHWNTRVCRALGPTPAARSVRLDGTSDGKVGETMPFPLHEGPWRISATLSEGSWSETSGFRIDIIEPNGGRVHHLPLDRATIDGAVASWTLHQPYLLFALSLQIWVDAAGHGLTLELPLDVRALR